MCRIVAILVTMFVVAAMLFSQTQPRGGLRAPTYYIAGNAEYRSSDTIWLRGASNLPTGSELVVDVQNYVGEGSESLAARALPRLGEDGFFEATLTPLLKMKFTHNIVCLVSFFPNIPAQNPTVTKAVGKHGEKLGFPKNPQTNIISGENVYLSAAIHVE